MQRITSNCPRPFAATSGYTSPEGIAHSYEYLRNDRLKKIDFDGKVLDLSYDMTRLQQILYPNGVTTDYSYNFGGWLSGIQTKKRPRRGTGTFSCFISTCWFNPPRVRI